MVHRMNIAWNRIHLNILPLVSCELNPVRHLHPRSRNASLIQDLQTSLSAGQTSHLCRKVRLNQLINHEIKDAPVAAQVVGLSSTEAGRRILDEVGMVPRIMEERRIPLTRETRATYMVGPFPRNVNPQHNEGRRKARARTILQRVRDDIDSVVFVDTAQYGNTRTFASSVTDGRGVLRSSASVRAATPGIAGQIAVALALCDPELFYVYTDSRDTITAFEMGNFA
ncbi:hypothetical protein HPB50_012563 [Hyalomma asiaticum]|uniref:Uncharacterized protein n=1 Tax=Hyalomma asiaticum TaxID=266040 RepID=A0ACB7SE70_HYAAI|nr:hypothetical protein HPB50_012563 [Hyalomma asiaticum]